MSNKDLFKPNRMRILRDVMGGTIDEFIEVCKDHGVESSLSRNHIVNRSKAGSRDVLFTDEKDLTTFLQQIRDSDSEEAVMFRSSLKGYYDFIKLLYSNLFLDQDEMALVQKAKLVTNAIDDLDEEMGEIEDSLDDDDLDDDDLDDDDRLTEDEITDGFDSLDDDDDLDDDEDLDLVDDEDLDLDDDEDLDLDDDEDLDLDDDEDLDLDDDIHAPHEIDDLDDIDIDDLDIDDLDIDSIGQSETINADLDLSDSDGEAWDHLEEVDGNDLKRGQTLNIGDPFENDADDVDEYDLDNVEI